MQRFAILLTLGLLAGACGGEESDGAPTSSTSSTTTTAAPPPVTVPSTTVPSTTVPSNTVPSTAVPPTGPYVPGESWETVDLEAAGFDPSAFAAAVDLAEAVDSHCLVVLRDGRLVHESYGPESGPDVDHPVFSVTKSVTAAIVGVAETRGLVDVGAPASDHLDEWIGTDSEGVTVAQILQNTSGRFYDFGPDLVELGGKPDMTTHSIGLTQEREPDTAWFYNQSAIQTLEAVVERATGEDPEAFARQHLFDPIGMSVQLPRDEAGNIPMFAGLQAGCRDLARFALLSSRSGTWGDEELITADFMADATTGRTDLNRAYGYLYWHNAEPGTWDHTNPARDRTARFWPDLPIDTFSANGLGEQFATVFPSEGIIVVRIGPPDGVRGYDGLLSNDLPSAVLDAFTGRSSQPT
jgi:CubicO group peptidase (beta-lactamase class C family)